jgi:hypothetical protein
MRINKFTAAALLAIGATGVTAGTAYAAPAQVQPAHSQVAPVLQGVDHGISYRSTLAAGNALVTTVTAGTFAMTPDNKAVTVADAGGALVGTVPTSVHVDGHTITVRPTIDRSGTRLTLTPVVGQVSGLRDINSQQWFFYELQRASLGGIVGAIIGAIIGFFGLFVSAIPGAIIGGIIGLLVVGGQPLINSGSAYFSGQP